MLSQHEIAKRSFKFSAIIGNGQYGDRWEPITALCYICGQKTDEEYDKSDRPFVNKRQETLFLSIEHTCEGAGQTLHQIVRIDGIYWDELKPSGSLDFSNVKIPLCTGEKENECYYREKDWIDAVGRVNGRAHDFMVGKHIYKNI